MTGGASATNRKPNFASVLFEKFEQESPALDLPGVVAAPRRSYQSDLRRGA